MSHSRSKISILNYRVVALRRLGSIGMALLLVSCGGGGGGTRTPEPEVIVPPDTGLLVSFSAPAPLLNLIKAGLKRELQTSFADTATTGVPTPSQSEDAATASFSTTYTQDTSVDEHDVVKYDGQRLFIAPSRSMPCCFIVNDLPVAADAAAVLPPPVQEVPNRAIRIMTTDPATAGVTETGRIALNAEETVEGLYLAGERLAALTSTAWWGHYGEHFALLSNWTAERVGIALYDIGQPQNPLISRVEIEGALVASRRTADGIYIVSRHTPSIEGLNYSPQTQAEVDNNNTLIDALALPDLLPEVTIDGAVVDIFSAADCYATNLDDPLAPAVNGHPILTSVILLDSETGTIKDQLCYSETTSGVYLSADALYFVQNTFDADNIEATLLHRFSLGSNIAYGGSARVRGSLFLGGNRDFRISEQAGVLRVVTTQFTNDAADRWDHRLYMLAQDTTDPHLNVLGELPNSLRPEPIGKPNEDLFGVRFLGNRAYLVTFERTDPLYVLDLSAPSDPLIAGSLEVTGFSNFLHPVSDQLLLGLGQSASGHTKLELFDVSDLANPLSRGSLEAAQELNYSYSVAEYDRHAFTYLPRELGNDRFAIPVSGAAMTASQYLSVNRLYLFEVADKSDPALASLLPNGYLSVEDSPYYYDTPNPRSVLDGDAVYFISDDAVYAALWGDPYNQVGPR